MTIPRKLSFRAFCLAGTLLWLTHSVAEAQIRYLTYQAPRSPLPAGAILPSQPAPATVAPPSAPPVAQVPATSRITVPVRPSLDKDELDRRVVAFQIKRAEEGSVSAQYELGNRYMKGEGVVKDDGTARKWLSMAAEGGNEQARKKLAELGVAAKPPAPSSAVVPSTSVAK